MADFSSYGGRSEEWQAVERTLPSPPPQDQSLEDLKIVTNQGRDKVSAKEMVEQGLSERILLKRYHIPTRDGSEIDATVYRPLSSPSTNPLPIYIHLHGGGFLFGTSTSEDAACSRIVVNLSLIRPVVVVNVNYRHTPEYVYPTAWNDVEDAFDWIHSHVNLIGGIGEQVVVGGISAGGQLAASLVLQQKSLPTSWPRIKGQILMIPCLVSMDCYDGMFKRLKDSSASSMKENEFAPILPLEKAKMFTELLKVEVPDVNDRRLNPGYATADEVKELVPPTVFGVAGLDPLRDEALLYAKHLTGNAIPTKVNVFRGVPHGFRRFGERLSQCKRWDMVICDGIKWALDNPVAAEKFEIKVE